jgi:hypothetical protein
MQMTGDIILIADRASGLHIKVKAGLVLCGLLLTFFEEC